MYINKATRLQEKLQKMGQKGVLISFYDFIRLASWKICLPYHTMRMLIKLKLKSNNISKLSLLCYLNSQKGFTQKELGMIFQIKQSVVSYHVDKVSKVWQQLQFTPSPTVEQPCSYVNTMESYVKERF